MSSSRNNSCDGGDGGCFSPELDVVSCTPCPQSSASSVDDMKEKRYFCQRCLNHGLEFPRKGHKPFCRYAQCNCEDCMMVEHRRRLNNQLSQRKNELVDGSKRSPPGKKIRDPKCARCTAHGENQALRGHKKSMCPFLKCCCNACGLVETRRKLMARQIKLRRDQQKARNAQFYKPDGDTSNEPSATTPPTKDGFFPPAPVSRAKKRSSCSTKSTSSSSSPTGMPAVVDSIPLAASKMPNNINLFPSIKFDLGLLAAQLSPTNFSFAHQFNGHHNSMQFPNSRLFGIEGQKADRILPNDCTTSSTSSITPFSALNLVNLNTASLNAPFLMGDKQGLPSPIPSISQVLRTSKLWCSNNNPCNSHLF
uniref:DM domain-containing protein n=1 Tax=Ditylenchus dipsaci TaxID=166011 RepID=A0A915D4G1_9BILA